MGETDRHRTLVDYLKWVLEWLFHEQLCTVYANLNFYQTDNDTEHPLAPDIAVIKGVNAPDFRGLTSWRVGTTGPAPQVVFEIASAGTWKTDLEEKPLRYAQMGVSEYYAYDPNVPLLPRSEGRRLRGWQLDHRVSEMSIGSGGRLWSPQLTSFLVPEKEYLRLYDRHGHMLLTRDEAADRRADMEALARREADRRANMEAKRADAQARRAQIEAERADREALARQLLEEKLRSLGIDPDQIV